MNERGQEGLTLTTLLLIILGVVAVVVIILFFNGFFGKLNNATDNLPSDLQAAISACELAGSSNLQADYCLTFRKVTLDGQEQYQTCDTLATKYITDNTKKMSCGGVASADANAFCQGQKLKAGTRVGSITCSGNYTAS